MKAHAEKFQENVQKTEERGQFFELLTKEEVTGKSNGRIKYENMVS